MNRFQNGLLIWRGHGTWQLMHQSEIDLQKFHSTLSRVIGFFWYAPKISLRPRFFLLLVQPWNDYLSGPIMIIIAGGECVLCGCGALWR